MPFKERHYIVILIALILLSSAAVVWAADDGFASAKRAEGKYTEVGYFPEISAASLIQELNMRLSDKVLAGVPLDEKSSDENELTALLDSLFIRISDILDMHLYSLKVNVKVCRDQKELADVYKNIFNAGLGDQRSFYVYDTNTIYVSKDSFKREIIGHEMAHSIISHYFAVPAPVKIQKVLSMYVDYNLSRGER